ncbi:SDR family NAD(P)-dependent oxidoreductase [Clostridium felsineum]|uniref:3-oxoacyl-[acyl-carrier-protein] reductase FabG n=1 Tax=Clostridium felsineum TaxID=36839 RepID=A0A1S8KZX8_9CLOT|nr:SDR family oxidoreductase [Clostridium felsineum]URZ06415.1 3-oxoacyl-[acyl-carrier-protein] reductase FabG [Clostridium felsineum]URZ11450.1 3-oxoacyl-[acyl-carrier-protein] reductase FabG [Clostridium felsineum]
MDKKIALITGGSGGIGAKICSKLAENKYYVYINCRNEDKAKKLLDEIIALGGEGEVLVFDLNSKESLIEGINKIKFSKIDILVNNAGVLRDNIIYNMKMEDYDLVFKTNFIACLDMYDAVLSRLEKSEAPVVINMCSISGVRPRTGQLAYGVSKAMLIEWTKSMAKCNENIRYYAVSPGPVETELIKTSKWYNDKKSIKRIPLGRYAKPEEIADFISYIIDNPKIFKSGSNIILDGGFLQTTKE